VRILPSILAIEPEMNAWRHHLHAHPELGFEEHSTARFIAEKLRSWGLATTEGIGRTGVVATLEGRLGAGGSLGIRADMDALPMHEATGLPYASRVPGRMHACGHDGHTSILLGAAKALAAEPVFAGTVHFIFQPAEEGLGGARAMLADQLFERFPCDEVYALHNSERPLGQVVIYDGAVAAAADRFDIVVHGKGGHAATPHLAIDPIPIAARILLDIEALPGRLTDVSSPAVVTVGAFSAGEAFNTIPDHARLVGTVRCFSSATRDVLERAIRRLSAHHAQMHGARCEITYESPFAPTVNTPAEARALAEVAQEIVGGENVVRNAAPEMGSEDFSFLLEQRPGCYALLGQGDADHQAIAHDSRYDFNDAILPIGASLWVRLVERRLAPTGPARTEA
jgi:amidohydrolase